MASCRTVTLCGRTLYSNAIACRNPATDNRRKFKHFKLTSAKVRPGYRWSVNVRKHILELLKIAPTRKSTTLDKRRNSGSSDNRRRNELTEKRSLLCKTGSRRLAIICASSSKMLLANQVKSPH